MSPQNSHVEILAPKVLVIGRGALERINWSLRECDSARIKEIPGSSPFSLPFEDTAGK